MNWRVYLEAALAILIMILLTPSAWAATNGLNYTTYLPAGTSPWVSPNRDTLTPLTSGTVANIYTDWDFVLDSGRNSGVVVKFTGYYQAGSAGTYNFGLEGDDGVELIMKGQTVISHWADQPGTFRSGAITLTAGEIVPITIWYYENGGGARLRFTQQINGSYTAVPTTQLATGSTLWAPVTCNPCSPNDNNPNLGFELGTTSTWLISNGPGTVKAPTTWNSNGTGVAITSGIANYSPGGGKTWNVTPYGQYMMSIQAGTGSPNFDPAMTSLGLNSTEITAIRNYLTGLGGNSTPTNASWAKKEVTLQAGVTYTIAWQYLSTDYVPFNDGSVMTLRHVTSNTAIPTLNNSQQRYALLGFTNPGTGNYATDSYGSTGWQLAQFTVPVDGNYVLGFASFNLGDTALSPILLVDDLQGTTQLNGTTFNPIAPNAGSTAPSATPTAPTLCCGGSSTAFTIDTDKSAAVNAFKNRVIQDSRVFIEQIGNNNVISVQQTGTKNNYVDYNGNGSDNNITVTQSGTMATEANYVRLDVTGNSNTVNLTQTSTGGSKSTFATVNDNNHSITILQKDSGGHHLDLTLSGGAKTVNITQQGSAAHMADITLTGTGTRSIDLTQQGTTQQHYSINSSCAASCQAITVTQGQ